MDAKTYLRKFLEDGRMTQRSLADALGVTQSAIGNWLGGIRPIPPQHALKMQQLYRLDAAVLCPKLAGLVPKPDSRTESGQNRVVRG